eukprot:scaffold149_cov315-Pinguiococcus_pyrenoidosus.AAC.106
MANGDLAGLQHLHRGRGLPTSVAGDLPHMLRHRLHLDRALRRNALVVDLAAMEAHPLQRHTKRQVIPEHHVNVLRSVRLHALLALADHSVRRTVHRVIIRICRRALSRVDQRT